MPQGSLGSTFGEPFTEDLEVMDSSSHRGHGARERPAPADVPDHVEYLIIGAGVHGLSTAWHLGLRMKAEGKDPGKRVLVVEDEAGVRDLAVRALQMAGYQVVEAPDGAAALEVLAAHRDGVVAVVSDVAMPAMGVMR